ncbi:hypothetical protein TWF694_004361 [Orbilia ellipsospora]|uniref:Uncharacterized protein n=1 Tax=Orbilia ellipsospora TaxID=2528407 RepID=A0AAV9WXP9_9PEZI
MAENLSFNIELEYDSIKNSELGSVGSKVKVSDAEPGATVLEDPTAASLESGSETGKTSYLSLTPTTMQLVRPDHTLFVWDAAFHPSVGRRFQNVVLSIKFSDPEPVSSPLKIVAHAPRRSFDSSTWESNKTLWGQELPLVTGATELSGAESASPTASPIVKEVEHTVTITGTARGYPRKTTCVWTIEENPSSERGIPLEAQFAVLVNHTSSVKCDVKISARTAGGILPPHYLRARTSPQNRSKIIEPSKYIGRLREYSFGQGGSDCEAMLANWPGTIAGATVKPEPPFLEALTSAPSILRSGNLDLN